MTMHTQWRVEFQILDARTVTAGPPVSYGGPVFSIGRSGETGSPIGGSHFVTNDASLTDTNQWHDATCDVVEMSWERGKPSMREPYVPGTATIDLIDDGRYNPLAPKSPFRRAAATTLNAGVGVRISCIIGAVEKRMWTGYVAEWPVALSTFKEAVRRLRCIDMLGDLSSRDAGQQGDAPLEHSHLRVSRWLDSARIPAASRDIPALTEFSLRPRPINGNVLSGLRETVAATLDDLYVTRGGVIRLAKWTGLELTHTIVNSIVVPETPTIEFHNHATAPNPMSTAPDFATVQPLATSVVTAPGFPPAVASRLDTQHEFGSRTERVDLPLFDNFQALTAAKRRINSQPKDGLDLRRITLAPDWSPTTRTWLASAEMGSWVAVKYDVGTRSMITSTAPPVYESAPGWTAVRHGWLMSERHTVRMGNGSANGWTCELGIADANGLGIGIFIS